MSPGAITGPFTSMWHQYRQQQRGGKRGGKSPGGENLRIDMADVRREVWARGLRRERVTGKERRTEFE